MRYFPFFVAGILIAIAYFRVDYQPTQFSSALNGDHHETIALLDQPFTFLGKGRQSFAFVSEDGNNVLKFFNKKYFKIPWYNISKRELLKRAKREKFFKESYLVAGQFLKEETGLISCHFEKTRGLPKVLLKDKASRTFTIDLNEVSFVIQRKGKPFYSTLEEVYASRGKEGLCLEFRRYFQLIAKRISLSIEDGDHDVEHNYGYLDGNPFQLDPGRLLKGDLFDQKKTDHEWWVATHAFRKWLEKKHPDMVSNFDEIQKESQ